MTAAVGYVLKKFPRLSETFILHEILAQEESGSRIEIFSQRQPDEGRFHPALGRLRATVRYLPEMRPSEAWDWFVGRAASLEGALDGLPDAIRMLARFRLPQGQRLLSEALFVAHEAAAAGVKHLHAHFATGASHLAHLVGRLTGIPYSFTAHAKDLYRETVNPDLFRAIADGARFVVTVCEANRTFIREKLYAGGRTPVLRLYNGVDLRFFSPQGDAYRGRKVVGIGRLIEKKGFDDLLEACRRLRDAGKPVECTIVGEGEERERLEATSRAAGLDGTVRFTGALPQPQTADLIHASSAVVLPCVVGSDGNRDALPTVLLEGLACGRPVISSPVGGVAEIVDEGRNGLLVPPRDPSALARAMDALLAEPEAVRRMGRQGREKAEAVFDLRRNAATLAGWFAASVEGRAPASDRSEE
jgi:glycosyltransferase involved in cell wall biosynthesis